MPLIPLTSGADGKLSICNKSVRLIECSHPRSQFAVHKIPRDILLRSLSTTAIAA